MVGNLKNNLYDVLEDMDEMDGSEGNLALKIKRATKNLIALKLKIFCCNYFEIE